MRSRLLGAILALAVIFLTIPLLSQEKADKDKPARDKKRAVEDAGQDKKEDSAPDKDNQKKDKDGSKLFVDLSGLMYLEWAYFTGYKYKGTVDWTRVPRWGIDITSYPTLAGSPPTNYSKKDNNTFRMQRAYLTLQKRIGDIFSVKITTDIEPTGQDFIYLKYGFVQLYKEFNTPLGSIKLKAQLGKIATPVIGRIDYLSDLRWLGANYLNSSKFVLNGKSFDNSADLGGLVSLSLLNMVTIEYSFTNGEGYKFDDSEAYAGKSHTLMVSVNPLDYIKELHVNFYGRWEDTNRNRLETTTSHTSDIRYSGIDKRSYMGFGVAWYSDVIKAGLNFFMPEMQFSKTAFLYPVANFTTGYTPRYVEKFYLIDSWVNFNLGGIVPTAPVLIVGRCAYGKELKSLLGNQRQSRETLIAGVGAGYQFSENFRMVLYYEWVNYNLSSTYKDPTRKNPSPNNNVYIKAEAKY